MQKQEEHNGGKSERSLKKFFPSSSFFLTYGENGNRVTLHYDAMTGFFCKEVSLLGMKETEERASGKENEGDGR